MAQQNATETELTDQQLTAIELLLSGQGVSQVAEQVDVDRSTLWRWGQLPAFQAELNRRRQELWSAHADRLRSLLPAALQVLENTLECEPDGWRVALAIVKMADFGALAPSGETDPAAIELKRRSARADAKNQEQMVELQELIAGV